MVRPKAERISPCMTIGVGGEAVAAWIEDGVDLVMGGEEPPCLAGDCFDLAAQFFRHDNTCKTIALKARHRRWDQRTRPLRLRRLQTTWQCPLDF